MPPLILISPNLINVNQLISRENQLCASKQPLKAAFYRRALKVVHTAAKPAKKQPCGAARAGRRVRGGACGVARAGRRVRHIAWATPHKEPYHCTECSSNCLSLIFQITASMETTTMASSPPTSTTACVESVFIRHKNSNISARKSLFLTL